MGRLKKNFFFKRYSAENIRLEQINKIQKKNFFLVPSASAFETSKFFENQKNVLDFLVLY